MEVLGKEKVGTTFSGNELFEVKQAIQKHLETSDSIYGRHVRIMLDNLKVIDPVLMPLVEEHGEVVSKYCKKDDNGQIIRTPQGFEYDNDDAQQKYEAESKRIWDDTKLEVELCKFPQFIFDEMTFNMSQNDKVFLIYDYLVDSELNSFDIE